MHSRALGSADGKSYNFSEGADLCSIGRGASMSSTPSATAAKPATVAQRSEKVNDQAAIGAAAQRKRKPAGFGLPCAKCRTYYSADLKVCPVCKGAERVSPTVVMPAAETSPSEPMPDPIVLEQEREKFLREFKAQLFTSQMQLHSAARSQCIRAENHQSSSEAAAVCQNCYDHLQERVDVLEAALHMDLKEAALLVYEAVWADPSDSQKTYENAAHALLTELRKRSGVTPTFGLLKPLTD